MSEAGDKESTEKKIGKNQEKKKKGSEPSWRVRLS
jgi:hypothetical protein